MWVCFVGCLFMVVDVVVVEVLVVVVFGWFILLFFFKVFCSVILFDKFFIFCESIGLKRLFIKFLICLGDFNFFVVFNECSELLFLVFLLEVEELFFEGFFLFIVIKVLFLIDRCVVFLFLINVWLVCCVFCCIFFINLLFFFVK